MFVLTYLLPYIHISSKMQLRAASNVAHPRQPAALRLRVLSTADADVLRKTRPLRPCVCLSFDLPLALHTTTPRKLTRPAAAFACGCNQPQPSRSWFRGPWTSPPSMTGTPITKRHTQAAAAAASAGRPGRREEMRTCSKKLGSSSDVSLLFYERCPARRVTCKPAQSAVRVCAWDAGHAWFPALRFRSSVSVNRLRNRVRTAVQ